MARVAQSTTIPIATGERLLTKFEFVELLERQAATILQMDLTITGGILEAKKIAAMAEGHYAQIAPHMYGGPIAELPIYRWTSAAPTSLFRRASRLGAACTQSC